MKAFGIFVALVLVLGAVRGDGEQDLQNLASGLGSTSSNTPTLDDAKRIFREKCLQNADEQAWELAKVAPETARDCVQSLINRTELEHEIEVAKPIGELDEVFQKYCRKTPQLLQCTRNFTATITPCLDENERTNANVVLDIVRSLTEFVCFKDGDRIALFYAEAGPECLSQHQEDIKDCVNSTIASYTRDQELSLDNLPSLSANAEQCKRFRDLQNCVIPKLEQCREPTPANIIDSLLKFVYRKINCHVTSRPNSG